MKCIRVLLDEHVDRLGDTQNAYEVSVETSVGRTSRRWEGNVILIVGIRD
jgi:hypothetical protein